MEVVAKTLLLQLDSGAVDHFRCLPIRVRFHHKQVTKQIEVRSYPKISLAQMDENNNVKKGVGGEMTNL